MSWCAKTYGHHEIIILQLSKVKTINSWYFRWLGKLPDTKVAPPLYWKNNGFIEISAFSTKVGLFSALIYQDRPKAAFLRKCGLVWQLWNQHLTQKHPCHPGLPEPSWSRPFLLLLFDHVGLPHVLDLAVHLVHLPTWMDGGGHQETFSL